MFSKIWTEKSTADYSDHISVELPMITVLSGNCQRQNVGDD